MKLFKDDKKAYELMKATTQKTEKIVAKKSATSSSGSAKSKKVAVDKPLNLNDNSTKKRTILHNPLRQGRPISIFKSAPGSSNEINGGDFKESKNNDKKLVLTNKLREAGGVEAEILVDIPDIWRGVNVSYSDGERWKTAKLVIENNKLGFLDQSNFFFPLNSFEQEQQKDDVDPFYKWGAVGLVLGGVPGLVITSLLCSKPVAIYGFVICEDLGIRKRIRFNPSK